VRRVAAVACIAVAVVASVVWTLHTHYPSTVGSNSIRPVAFLGAIPPGAQACDAAGSSRLPVDAVRVTVGTNGRGPQPLRAQIVGSSLGSVLREYADGVVTIPVAHEPRLGGGRACVRNLGTEPVQIAGEQAAPGEGAVVGRSTADFHVSFILVDNHPPTWGSQAGAVLARTGLGRAWPGGGRSAGALVVTLLALCLLGAMAVVWRWIV
jgi:hypothetical protein